MGKLPKKNNNSNSAKTPKHSTPQRPARGSARKPPSSQTSAGSKSLPSATPAMNKNTHYNKKGQSPPINKLQTTTASAANANQDETLNAAAIEIPKLQLVQLSTLLHPQPHRILGQTLWDLQAQQPV